MFGLGIWLTLGAVIVISAVIGRFVWQRHLVRRQEKWLDQARKQFHQRREWLEARFMTLASQTGKPRGLAWDDCNFEDPVSFARDRQSGDLRALVGVTIRFRAIEGGGMEDNPNVANLRAATALFRLANDQWETDGRALFNLNPAEAIKHFESELELVEVHS